VEREGDAEVVLFIRVPPEIRPDGVQVRTFGRSSNLRYPDGGEIITNRDEKESSIRSRAGSPQPRV
jgi:hypothetical protein